jgi:GNAT superfamily N-acetyltransferase
VTDTANHAAIVELVTETELREAFPLMKQLRTHLTEETYLDLLAKMKPEGYRLFALRDASEYVALAGVAVRHTLYYGAYVYVFDLVTTQERRSMGYGKQILAFVDAFARREGCNYVTLWSRLERADAHRFYETQAGMEKRGYVFVKPLSE